MAAHAGFAYDATIRWGAGRARGRGTVWQFTSVDTTGDASSPVLTPISPPPGVTITPITALVVQVEDETGFALREIWAKFSSSNQWELVHDGAAFVAPYSASSVATELGTPGPGYYDRRTYTVRRSGGWPANAAFVRLRFTVADSSGNLVVLS